MTPAARVLRKNDLSPNKITSVGHSVPAFDCLIFVAGSHRTVSKHSWLFFSETKFNFTVSIKNLWKNQSLLLTNLPWTPVQQQICKFLCWHEESIYNNSLILLEIKNLPHMWMWDRSSFLSLLSYSVLAVSVVKFPTLVAQNNKCNKICWFAWFALIINLLGKRRYFTQVKEFIQEQTSCQRYIWWLSLTISRTCERPDDKRWMFTESSSLLRSSSARGGAPWGTAAFLTLMSYADVPPVKEQTSEKRISIQFVLLLAFTLSYTLPFKWRAALHLGTVQSLKVSILPTTLRG